MKRRAIALLLFFIVGACLPWLPVVQEGEGRALDLRFRMRGALPEKSRVVIVAIDDDTELAWRDIPKAMWSGELAKVVAALNAAGAKRIAIDLVISVDPDNYLSSIGVDATPNANLDQAIIETDGRILLGTSRAGDVVAPLDSPERLVSVNRLGPDAGVVRQVPRLDPKFDPAIPGLASELAAEISSRIDPIDINYSGRSPVIVSARDVIESRYPSGLFRGALVIVGETFQGSGDTHESPFGKTVPGVVIQAEATRTVVDGNELWICPTWLSSVLTAIISLSCAALAFRVWVGRYYLVIGGLALIWSVGNYVAFWQMNAVWPLLAPLAVTIVAVPAAAFAMRAMEENRERLWARSIWGQLVGESTIARLESNRKTGLGAWDEFDCCLMFLDVVDFSKLMQKNRESPATIVTHLNTLFGATIKCIDAQGGEVLNFMGDGLAAKWERGAHTPAELQSQVLASALKILDQADRLNSTNAYGEEHLQVRIGLSSGVTTLALIGSSGRQQMTLYGEAVNLAARLEAVGKDEMVRSRLVVSDDYAQAAQSSGKRFESFNFTPKGWTEPILAWRLVEVVNHS